MKKILLVLIFICASFSLFSCDKDSGDDTLFQTPLKEIFGHFEKKSYAFSATNEEKYSKTLNDRFRYELEYDTNSFYTLTIYDSSSIYKSNYKDTFGDIFYIDNTIYFIHFKYEDDLSSGDSLIISKYQNNNFEDVFTLKSVQEGYVNLIKEDNYFYLYNFNSMSNFFCLTRISLDFTDSITKIISKASYIRNMYVVSSNEFYYIDGTTVYYYNDEFDNIDVNPTYIATEMTYLYNKNDQLYFYEIKATNYVINTNLILREQYIEKNDLDYNLYSREIYNTTYNFRKFDYICYKNKVIFIFKEFLGIIEYDLITGMFYGYCNPYENVESFKYKNDTLLLKISGKKCYYKLDLSSI